MAVLFLENSNWRSKIEEEVVFHFAVIKYTGQLKSDHCGSSAILISMEFNSIEPALLRFGVAVMPKGIFLGLTIRVAVRKQCHKYNSNISLWQLKNAKPTQNCIICGWKSNSSKRETLRASIWSAVIEIKSACPPHLSYALNCFTFALNIFRQMDLSEKSLQFKHHIDVHNECITLQKDLTF